MPGLADGAELIAAAALSGLAAAVLARAGRVALLAATLLSCILLLPLAAVVTARGPRVVAAGALAAVQLPIFAWSAARIPAGQWATARRLGASPILILRRLVAPAVIPFLVAALLAGGALLAWRRPPPPAPLLLPYPSEGAG